MKPSLDALGAAAGSRLQPIDTLNTRFWPAALGGHHLRGSVAVTAGCPASGSARRTTGDPKNRFLH
jgi:hypothetical protein